MVQGGRMALGWLNKMCPSKGQYFVEGASLIYTFLTSIAIIILYHQMDHPGEMLMGRALIVVGTFVFISVYRKYPCKVTAFLRIAFQMSLLTYWYSDTFEFNRLLPNLDHIFAQA